MRTSLVRMHKHFGNLGKIYGEYKFGVSPYEQKAMKGFFDDAFTKVFRRYVVQKWMFFVPPVTCAYLVCKWGAEENLRFSRKDPKTYENDE